MLCYASNAWESDHIVTIYDMNEWVNEFNTDIDSSDSRWGQVNQILFYSILYYYKYDSTSTMLCLYMWYCVVILMASVLHHEW